MASEPLYCAVRQHYCRCHDFGKRCDDYAAPQAEPRLKGPGRSDGCVDSIAETASPADAAPIPQESSE